MLWRVDPRDPFTQVDGAGRYEQIAGGVRRALGEGTLHPGDRLPSGKDLATSLDVNLHTVLRAYQELRAEGLIELRRGRGAVVLASGRGASQLAAMVDELIAQAERLGVSRGELVRMINEEDTDA